MKCSAGVVKVNLLRLRSSLVIDTLGHSQLTVINSLQPVKNLAVSSIFYYADIVLATHRLNNFNDFWHKYS